MTRRPIRFVAASLIALCAACTAGAALALPRADAPGREGAPPLLPGPRPTAPVPAPAADTSAMLPSGSYTMRVSMRGDAIELPAKVTRVGGTAVTVTLGNNETLAGTLDGSGQLRLAGSNGVDRLALASTVQSQRASGTATLGRGAGQIAGSFTLDRDGGMQKMKEYGAPSKPTTPECGFLCRLGKAWDCLSNWSKC